MSERLKMDPRKTAHNGPVTSLTLAFSLRGKDALDHTSAAQKCDMANGSLSKYVWAEVTSTKKLSCHMGASSKKHDRMNTEL